MILFDSSFAGQKKMMPFLPCLSLRTLFSGLHTLPFGSCAHLHALILKVIREKTTSNHATYFDSQRHIHPPTHPKKNKTSKKTRTPTTWILTWNPPTQQKHMCHHGTCWCLRSLTPNAAAAARNSTLLSLQWPGRHQSRPPRDLPLGGLPFSKGPNP